MTTPRPTPQNPAPDDRPLADATGTRPTADAAATVVIEPNYEVFGLWLDTELAKLVARYEHLAAPNASKPTSRRSNFF